MTPLAVRQVDPHALPAEIREHLVPGEFVHLAYRCGSDGGGFLLFSERRLIRATSSLAYPGIASLPWRSVRQFAWEDNGSSLSPTIEIRLGSARESLRIYAADDTDLRPLHLLLAQKLV